MDNRVDPMLGDQRGHKLRIAGITDDKQGALRYRPIESLGIGTGTVQRISK